MSGTRALHRIEDVEVEGAGQIRMDPALHANLGGARFPCFLCTVGHLVQGQGVGLRIRLPLCECAESAPHVADVREVDVPVDHVGDLVADGLVCAGRRPLRPAPRAPDPRPGTAPAPRRRRARPVGLGPSQSASGCRRSSRSGAHALARPTPGFPQSVDVVALEVPVDGACVRAQARVGGLGERQRDLPRLPLDLGVLPGDRLGHLPLTGQTVLPEQGLRPGRASWRRGTAPAEPRTPGRSPVAPATRGLARPSSPGVPRSQARGARG